MKNVLKIQCGQQSPIMARKEIMEIKIFFSTDGKHTVQVDAGLPEADEAYLKAKTIYAKMLAEFGTKQAQEVKEYAPKAGFPDDSGNTAHQASPGSDLGVCPKCGAPMKMSSKGKPYCSKVCWK